MSNPKSKRPSGAEYRKRKLAREKINQELSKQWTSLLKKSKINESSSSTAVSTSELAKNEPLISENCVNVDANNNDANKSANDSNLKTCTSDNQNRLECEISVNSEKGINLHRIAKECEKTVDDACPKNSKTVNDADSEMSHHKSEENETTVNHAHSEVSIEASNKYETVNDPNFEMCPRSSKDYEKSANQRESESDLAEEHFEINFNDPTSWPNINSNVRSILVQHGPDQGKDADFRDSTNHDGRSFSPDWFTRKLSNGESANRNWLIYNRSNNSLFCFSCIVFGSKGKTPNIANCKKGFSDWKHLYRVEEHENSMEHRKNYLEWKLFEKRMNLGGHVNDKLKRAIDEERRNWREVLRTILNVILFCARNNLPLRGGEGAIKEQHAGIFLNLLDLLSEYSAVLKQHIASYKKGGIQYFSPAIQNEFISLLSNKVRSEVLRKVRQAKYFSILFDCTPDKSHKQQMSQVVRYVQLRDGKVTIEETFLDFIATHEKTGEGLTNEILTKLQKDGLDVKNIRGQAYDNGSNMAGLCKGVQNRVKQLNNLAVFVPCAAHTLNLACCDSAEVSFNMKTFFGTIQRCFAFFASSTSRWEIMTDCMKLRLKRYCNTRWCSRLQAIKAMRNEMSNVKKALETILNTFTDNEVLSTAACLIKSMDYTFVCNLCVWFRILHRVNVVNLALQKKDITLDRSVQLIAGLKNCLQNIRDNCISEILTTEAPEIAGKINLAPGAKFNEHNEYIQEIDKVLHTLINHIDWRYNTLNEVAYNFGFLSSTFIAQTDITELKKFATDLSIKYEQDLNACEFCAEIESFKSLIVAISENVPIDTPLQLLQMLHDYCLTESYPNLFIALRIYLTIPVTTASNERSFSKLKHIKSYLRSSIGQERLSGLAILSIEHEISNSIDFDEIIDQFAAIKARKILL